MEALADRRRRLYGLDRSLARQDIVQTLTKSHVLQDGEYNYTNESLKDGIWQTSAKRDFPVRTDKSFFSLQYFSVIFIYVVERHDGPRPCLLPFGFDMMRILKISLTPFDPCR